MKQAFTRLVRSPAFLCLLGIEMLLGCLFAAKGIFPFGHGTIDYFDGTQVGLPNLYQLWDILHGRVSPFYDWYEALGTVILPCYLPDYLLLALLPRRGVTYFPAVILALRLPMAAAAMMAALRRLAPRLSPWLAAAGGALYACCGFAVQYYVLFIWLDFVALFPLVLLGVHRLLHEARPGLLIGVLAVLLALNVYMSAFVILFVLFYAGGQIFLVLPRPQRGPGAMRLGLCVAAAALVSAAFMLPIAVIALGSDRAGLAGGTLLDALGNYWQALRATENTAAVASANLTMLLGMGAPLVFLFSRLIPRLKETGSLRRTAAWQLGLLGLLALPLAFEAVNLGWHFGSYTLFPTRWGYILPAVILFFAGKELGERPLSLSIPLASPLLLRLLAGAAALGALGLGAVSAYALSQGGAVQAPLPWKWALLAAGLLFALAFLLLPRLGLRGPAPQRLAAALLAAQLGVNLYAYVAPANRVGSFEQHPQFVHDAAGLAEKLPPVANSLVRTKNPDTSLNNNYPLILGRPALSAWTDGIWTDTLDGSFRALFTALGYSESYTRILDQGGTLFSDAFIGVEQVVANWETVLPGDNAVLAADYGNYKLYNSRYVLPKGFEVSADEALAWEPNAALGAAENQNSLWRLVSGQKAPLLTSLSAAPQAVAIAPDEGMEAAASVQYRLALPAHAELYLHYQGSEQVSVYLDGSLVTLPYYQRPYNKAYPDLFINGLVDLGSFHEETVSVILENRSGGPLSPENLAQVHFFSLDRELLASFCETAPPVAVQTAGRHLTIAVQDSVPGNLLLLPVQYSKDWRATVNGEPAAPAEVGGGLLALPLPGGEAVIELSVFPPYFTLGVLLSALGLAGTAAFLGANRRLRGREAHGPLRLLPTAASALLALALGAALLMVYLVPLAAGLSVHLV